MGVKASLDRGDHDFVLVDVRLSGPQLSWRIPGSVAIPATVMAERFVELPQNKLVVLYFWDTWCSLATTAALVLLEHGHRVKELYGGVAAWQTLHLPQQNIAVEGSTPSRAC